MKAAALSLLIVAVSTLERTFADESGSDATNVSPSAPIYYDWLRTQLTDDDVVQVEGSNLFEVVTTTNTAGSKYLLGDVTTFIAFSDGNLIRAGLHNDAAVALLAAHHFNNLDESPIVTREDIFGTSGSLGDIKDCNVRLTLDILDTQFSPIESTRIFTQILQRNHTVETPLPAAVVGAYRSATTSPLAILTGVNDIPQVSYASTSTDFDVKEQFPRFGRTISSSTGEARSALDFFIKLGADHVGVLFVTDAFGSALQKAFQDAATEAKITTDSVAFSFAADLDGSEIATAVKNLKDTEFRLFYVIAFEQHYNPIMTAAANEGIVGDDYLWIFDGFDTETFHKRAVFPSDSPLATATPGVGLIQFAGGVSPEPYLPGQERLPPLKEDPVTGFEKFRTAWRDALNDEDMVAYFRSKLPTSLEEFYPDSFDRNKAFSVEPSIHSPFIYDAVIGLGVSMCRAIANNAASEVASAQGNVTSVTGEEIYDEFRNLDMEGSSGRVKITNTTGTRDYLTHAFVLYNVRPHDAMDEEEDGKTRYDIYPSSVYENGEWVVIPGNDFIYADGTTTPPDALPPVKEEKNYIGPNGRAIGYILMGIVMVLSVVSVVWLFLYRDERVVRSSQPLFLLMVSVGSFIMSTTIFTLSVEEGILSDVGLDSACQANVWLYLIGAIIAFSALLAKTRGIHQAYCNPELDFIHVTSCDIFLSFLVLFTANLIVLVIWTVHAPLEWLRHPKDAMDKFGRSVDSFGTCTSDSSLPFVIVVLVLNLGILCLANWWAYQARNIETEYHESRYIAISMASVLQAWCMGIPILIVVWDNPQAKFFVSAGIVFVTSLAVLALIFLPKVFAIRDDRMRAAAEDKRLAFLTFAERKKQDSGYDSDNNKETKIADSHADTADESARAKQDSRRHISTDLAGSEVEKSTSEGGNDGVKQSPQLEKDGHIGSSKEEQKPTTQPARSRRASRLSLPSFGLGTLLEPSTKTDGDAPTKRRSLVSFSSVAMRSADVDASLGGIKVLHNPRSRKSLESTNGREISKPQLENLKPHLVEDEQSGGPKEAVTADRQIQEDRHQDESSDATPHASVQTRDQGGLGPTPKPSTSNDLPAKQNQESKTM